MRVREMIAYFADFYEDFDAVLARDSARPARRA